MGQISSSVGLISGIPIKDLVDQLMAIEARPKQLVANRIAVLQSQQVAFNDINAKLLSLKLSISSLTNTTTFQATQVSSSNESVLTATSNSSAVPGAYSLIVDRLVTSQQLITKGFADQDTTAIGAGTLTFEVGDSRLQRDTELKTLNLGAGVRRGKIKITDRAGNSAIVDLSKALTVNDVIEAINNANGVSVTTSVAGDGFQIRDNTGSITTALLVEEVSGGNTAADLGLNVAAVDELLTGASINKISRDTLLASLNDGQGVRIHGSLNDFRIQRRNGTGFNVNLTGAATVGDIIDKINAADPFGSVTAQIDSNGTGISLHDITTFHTSDFAVIAQNGSLAAADLGILKAVPGQDIQGDRLIPELNSKLVRDLNGGSGVGLGQIAITNRAGATTNIDLSGMTSISQIIRAINESGAGVTASLNNAGNGLLLTDITQASSSDLIIADVSGTAAADLNLAGIYTASSVDSGNLQLRYISENTNLTQLNGGAGFTRGKFIITDSNGQSATVDLTQGNETTIGHVLAEINSRGLAVNARINDTGDGILIEDTGLGAVKLKVEESGSTTARDLGLLGEAANAGEDLNGRFERAITIDADDTLEDVAQKINESGFNVRATIINDGSGTAPYRLSINATRSGKAGSFVFDDGGLGFSASVLSQGRDAVAFFGSGDPAAAIAITSSTNSLNSLIPGTAIDLKGVADQPVTINIQRDDSSLVQAVATFVEDFNKVIDTLNNYDKYDAETKERGLLLGDSTVSVVRSSLYRLVNQRNGELSGTLNSLSQLGIRVGKGAKLEFDESRFRAALESDFDAVQQLFTFKQTQTDSGTNETTIAAAGIGVRLEQLLQNLTDTTDGVVQRRLNMLDSQVGLGNDRIEQFDKLLAAKRARMEAKFYAMEQVLAKLQAQGSSLTSLSQMAQQASSWNS